MTIRKQLSMFVTGEAAAAIEAVRRVVDPVQHGLIAAHVTLCREDEIEDEAAVMARVTRARGAIGLELGAVEAFGGHGLLLPCVAGEAAFRRLREEVLGRTAIRRQAPHVTVAHPRNPRVDGAQAYAAARLATGIAVELTAVALIEQRDGGAWRVLATHALA